MFFSYVVPYSFTEEYGTFLPKKYPRLLFHFIGQRSNKAQAVDVTADLVIKEHVLLAAEMYG